MTRQELDAEVKLLQKYKEKDICKFCDFCDGKGWCMVTFSQEARNEYVRRGLGCICGVDCRKYCKMAKECLGDDFE